MYKTNFSPNACFCQSRSQMICSLSQSQQYITLNTLSHSVKDNKSLPAEAPTLKTMAARADSAHFGAIISNQHHVLRSLCKESPAITYNLRPRSYPFELPDSDCRNFLSRLMYQDIYTVSG